MKKTIKITKKNSEPEPQLSQFQKILEKQSLNVIKLTSKDKEVPKEKEKQEVLQQKVLSITKDHVKQNQPQQQQQQPQQQQQTQGDILKVNKLSLLIKQSRQSLVELEKKPIIIQELRPAQDEKKIIKPFIKSQQLEVIQTSKNQQESLLSSQIKPCGLTQQKQVEEKQNTVIIDLENENEEEEQNVRVKSESLVKITSQKRPMEGQKKKIKIVSKNQQQQQLDIPLVKDTKSPIKSQTLNPQEISPIPSKLLNEELPQKIEEEVQIIKEQSESIKPTKKIICKNKIILKVATVQTEPLTQNQQILEKISSTKSSQQLPIVEKKSKGYLEEQEEKLSICVEELDNNKKCTENAIEECKKQNKKTIYQPLASIVNYLKDDQKDNQEAYVSFLELAFSEAQNKLVQQKKKNQQTFKDTVKIHSEKDSLQDIDNEDTRKERVLGSKRRFLDDEKYVNISTIPEQNNIQTSKGIILNDSTQGECQDQNNLLSENEKDKLGNRNNQAEIAERKDSMNSQMLIEDDKQNDYPEGSNTMCLEEQEQKAQQSQEEDDLFSKGDELSRQKHSQTELEPESNISQEKELDDIEINGKHNTGRISQSPKNDIDQIEVEEKEVINKDQTEYLQESQQQNNFSPSNHNTNTPLDVDSIDLSTPTKESKTHEEIPQQPNEKPKSKKIDLMTYYEESDYKDKETAHSSASHQTPENNSQEQQYSPYSTHNAHSLNTDVNKFIADVHSPSETNPLQMQQHRENNFYHESNNNDSVDQYGINYDQMEQEMYYLNKAQQFHAMIQEQQEEGSMKKGMGLFHRNLEVIHERVGEESESEKSQKLGKITPEDKSNDHSQNGSLSISDEKYPLKELSQNISTKRSAHTSFQKLLTTGDLEDDEKAKYQDIHEIDLEQETYLKALLKEKKIHQGNEKNLKEQDMQIEEKLVDLEIDCDEDAAPSRNSIAYGAIGRIQQQALRDTLE